VRVKPWRLAYYRAAFLSAREQDADLTMARWIRESCDIRAMAQFGDEEMPQPEYLFFDKASRRRRGDDEDDEIIGGADDEFDDLFGPPS